LAELIISCLSQKGGVGKSTLAQLIATGYAREGWEVMIADFNTTQNSSVEWAAIRARLDHQPIVTSAAYNMPSRLSREKMDLVVVDGRPESHQTSLDAARLSALVVLPTLHNLMDLRPQLRFALELVNGGVPHERILFVLNRLGESVMMEREARGYIEREGGFAVAKTALQQKDSWANMFNHGLSLAETTYDSLNARAMSVVYETIERINALSEVAA